MLNLNLKYHSSGNLHFNSPTKKWSSINQTSQKGQQEEEQEDSAQCVIFKPKRHKNIKYYAV